MGHFLVKDMSPLKQSGGQTLPLQQHSVCEVVLTFLVNKEPHNT